MHTGIGNTQECEDSPKTGEAETRMVTGVRTTPRMRMEYRVY